MKFPVWLRTCLALIVPVIAVDIDEFPMTQCECLDGATYAPITTGTAVLSSFTLADTSACEESDTGFSAPGDASDVSSIDFSSAATDIKGSMFILEVEVEHSASSSINMLTLIPDDGSTNRVMQLVSDGGSGLASDLTTDSQYEAFFLMGVLPSGELYQCEALVGSLDDLTCFLISAFDVDTETFSSLELLDVANLGVLDGGELDIFLRRFIVLSELEFDDTSTIEADVQSALEDNIDDRIVLPLFDDSDGEITEDTETEFDIETTFLSGGQNADLEFEFTFPDDVTITEDDELDSGIFTLEPASNSIVDIDIEFTYGISSPYECSFTETVTVVVDAVDDAPIAVEDVSVQGKAGLTTVISVLVAQSVDENEDGTLAALSAGTATSVTVTDSSFGTILEEDCSTALTDNSLDILNGNITFCFDADSSFQEGESTTITFTIEEDEGDETTEQSIEITGSNPVSVNVVLDAAVADEDGSIEFTFAGDVDEQDSVELVSIDDDDVDNEDITVNIVSLPDNGEISVNEIPLEVGDTVGMEEVVTYTPNANYFNSLDDESGTDVSGSRFDSSCDVDRITDEVCPDFFEFSTTVGGVVSTGGFVGFRVNAIDDASPSIDSDTTDSIQNVNGDNANNGLISTVLSGFSITNDDGSDAFEIDLTITTAGDVTFIAELDSTTNSVELSDDSCSAAQCSEVTITGIPSVLELIVNGQLDVRVPDDADGEVTSITLTVTNGDSESATQEFGIVFGEESFFDSVRNVAIVGGCGALLATVLIAFGIYRVTRKAKLDESALINGLRQKVVHGGNRKKKDKGALQTPAPAAAKEPAAEPKRSAPAHDPKKSLRIDPNDDIFDYEKHIDPETGDSYFFNPKTGHTTWDPPTIKSYQV